MVMLIPAKVLNTLDADSAKVWHNLINANTNVRVWAYADTDLTSGETVHVSALQSHDITYAWEGAGQYVVDLGVTWGDYTGSDLDRSNWNYLRDTYGEDKFVNITDIFGCQGLALVLGVVPEDSDLDEIDSIVHDLKRLDVYPLLDEDHHSEMINEMATESWNDYLRHDVSSELEGKNYSEDFYDRSGWKDEYKNDPRDNEDIVRDIYYGYDNNEWYAETATEVVNGRHDDAVRHVYETLVTEIPVPDETRRRVAYSGRVLDRIVPGWRDRDWSGLDMKSAAECVLGKVFAEEANASEWFSGGYGFAVDYLDNHSKRYFRDVMVKGGFTLTGRSGNTSWAELTQAWKNEIGRTA